jgi:hypothetical protein
VIATISHGNASLATLKYLTDSKRVDEVVIFHLDKNDYPEI